MPKAKNTNNEVKSVMYFYCPTLLSTMSVNACEANRKPKNVVTVKQCCKDCKQWKNLTTNKANLMTAEQVLNPIQAEIEKPQPVKFNIRNEISRVCSLSSAKGK
jgi:hypothetical protein